MSMYLDGRVAIISVAQRGKITIYSKPECMGDGKKYNIRKKMHSLRLSLHMVVYRSPKHGTRDVSLMYFTWITLIEQRR